MQTSQEKHLGKFLDSKLNSLSIKNLFQYTSKTYSVKK